MFVAFCKLVASDEGFVTGKSMRTEKCVKRDYSGERWEGGKRSGYISECASDEIWNLGS
jgi:hypothetical protein